MTRTPPEWIAAYVGPSSRDPDCDRADPDCYRLVHLVMCDRFGVEIPRYDADYLTALDRAEVGALVAPNRGVLCHAG